MSGIWSLATPCTRNTVTKRGVFPAPFNEGGGYFFIAYDREQEIGQLSIFPILVHDDEEDLPMGTCYTLHLPQPIDAIFGQFNERGVRFEKWTGGGRAVLTVDQAIEFALGEDDRTGNLLFATDHLVDGETIANYVHAGAFAGNLTGLDCYAANVIPDSIMNTLADAALIRAECDGVPGFEPVYEIDDEEYLVVDGTPMLIRCDRRVRPAERIVTPDDLEEEQTGGVAMWLPESRSIVGFGQWPEAFQQAEHDHILRGLLAEQRLEIDEERQMLRDFLISRGVTVPDDEVAVACAGLGCSEMLNLGWVLEGVRCETARQMPNGSGARLRGE